MSRSISIVSVTEQAQHGSRLPLAAVFLLALAVRVWGSSFALPYDLTADEPHHILQALKIGAGEGGPLVQMWHTIGKGGLDYLLFVEYGLLFVFWWLTGKVASADDFALAYLTDPTAFYLLGRWTMALAGAFTCVAVYHAGRRMFDARVALLAALIGALALDQATNAHLINVHIPMGAALWAAVWCYTCYEQDGAPRRLLWSGALAGLAISLAYNAVIVLAMLLGALATSAAPGLAGRRLAAFARLLGGALLGVALLSPDLLSGAGALLANFQQVLGGAPAGMSAAGAEARAAIDAVTLLREPDWRDYLRLLVSPRLLAVTLPALAGAAIGVARRERWAWLLAGAIVVLLAILTASDRGTAERYLVPVSPALWLLGARGIVGVARGRTALIAALAALALLPGAYAIARVDYTLGLTDSRVLAKRWIETHVAADSKLLIDGMRFRYIQSPPLKPNAAALAREVAALSGSELKYPKRFLDLYREARAALPGPGYDLHSTLYGLQLEDLDHYVRACFAYAVVSSDVADRYAPGSPKRAEHPRAARFYDGITRHAAYREVYRVSGAPWRAPGPTITVYRIASSCGD